MKTYNWLAKRGRYLLYPLIIFRPVLGPLFRAVDRRPEMKRRIEAGMQTAGRIYSGMMLCLVLLAVVGWVTGLTGCATPEHTVEKLETQNIDVKGRTVDGGRIAVTEDGQAVVQTERTAEHEIRSLELANYYLAEQVRDELWHLTDCRAQTTDPANGGSGEMQPPPEATDLRPPEKIKEEMGLTDAGDLKIVSKVYLDDLLSTERRYLSALKSELGVVRPLRQDCERRLKYVSARMRR